MRFPREAQSLSLALAIHLLLSVGVSMAGAGEKVYHNQFAVELAGGDHLADTVALRHGLLNMGKLGDLNGHYLFQSQHLQKRWETEFSFCNILVQMIFSDQQSPAKKLGLN